MRVKVCGITQQEQLEMLPEVGATFAGLIFYPKSPRYVLRNMTTGQLKKENNINKVGVFVNASSEEVLHMVDECRLHMVQLHGDETPRFCEKIADYIDAGVRSCLCAKNVGVLYPDTKGWGLQSGIGNSRKDVESAHERRYQTLDD